ncbi:MAG: hypothetical protein WC765_00650 [Phycisphaerae bacterium]
MGGVIVVYEWKITELNISCQRFFRFFSGCLFNVGANGQSGECRVLRRFAPSRCRPEVMARWRTWTIDECGAGSGGPTSFRETSFPEMDCAMAAANTFCPSMLG